MKLIARPQKHIFRSPNTSAYIAYTINAVPVYYLWLWCYKREYTDKILTLTKMSEYVSERSEQS